MSYLYIFDTGRTYQLLKVRGRAVYEIVRLRDRASVMLSGGDALELESELESAERNSESLKRLGVVSLLDYVCDQYSEILEAKKD